MNCIEPTIGTVYDPAHLHQAKSVEELLSLARQGHPLAWHNGNEVSHIFFNGISDSDVLTSIGVGVRVWNKDEKLWHTPRELDSLDYLRLAPLAVKDGKPLHVGDVIEENYSQPLDEEPSCELPIWTSPKPAYIGLEYEWRWPVEVK